MKPKLKRNRIVLGMDFDGVFNRLIPPMQWMMRTIRPDDIWARAHLSILRTWILKLYAYLPFILDGRVIDKTPRTVFIISGRTIRRTEAKRVLAKYGFRFFFFRPNQKYGETEWKIRMCKLLGVTTFYDDRPWVVKRLKDQGIDARLIDEQKWKSF